MQFRCLPGILHQQSCARYAANRPPRYAPNASLTTRGGCAMTAKRTTNEGKRCYSRWSTRRVSVCAPTQDDTTSHPMFHLTLQSKAEISVMNLQGLLRSVPQT